jgi:hypothetical protein
MQFHFLSFSRRFAKAAMTDRLTIFAILVVNKEAAMLSPELSATFF